MHLSSCRVELMTTHVLQVIGLRLSSVIFIVSLTWSLVPGSIKLRDPMTLSDQAKGESVKSSLMSKHLSHSLVSIYSTLILVRVHYSTSNT